MKKNFHPDYKDVSVQCVCGHVWETKSTASLNKVDICAACHPFYSGQQKVMDTEGRIDKFKKKYANYSTGTAKKK